MFGLQQFGDIGVIVRAAVARENVPQDGAVVRGEPCLWVRAPGPMSRNPQFWCRRAGRTARVFRCQDGGAPLIDGRDRIVWLRDVSAEQPRCPRKRPLRGSARCVSLTKVARCLDRRLGHRGQFGRAAVIRALLARAREPLSLPLFRLLILIGGSRGRGRWLQEAPDGCLARWAPMGTLPAGQR